MTDSSECVEYVLEKLTDCGFVPVIWDTPENFYLRKEGKIADDKYGFVFTFYAD